MSNTKSLNTKFFFLDNWLSKMIGKPTYYLEMPSSNVDYKDLPEGQMFTWTKIPANNTKKFICLQKLGFYIVDTNIQLSSSNDIHLKNEYNVRFALPNDELQVRVLAKNLFKHSRFNIDPNISEETACRIKEEWAGNFFSGKRGKWMIVIEENSKILGFLQIIDKNQDTIIIDLIAVDEKSKGKGLAKEMIAFAHRECLKENGSIQVGTQAANISSINLYLKLGFRVKSVSYVLHMHQ